MNKHFFLPVIACLCLGVRAEDSQWTGYSGGISLGAAQHTSSWTSKDKSVDMPSTDTRKLGLMPGLQLGYDWQQGKTIMGLELSHEFGVSTKEAWTGTDAYPVQRTDKLKSLTSLTFRWGLPQGNNLLFVRGGLGMVRAEHEFVPALSTQDAFTATNNKLGLVLGAGLERHINETLSFRVEYIHFEGGSSSYTRTTDEVFKTKERLDTLRVGLSWRF